MMGRGVDASGSARAPTLLIVDDHDRFRAFARSLLAAEGFVVVGEARDGASAIRAAEELEPDVVLLDVMLPDLDGFAVCARLAEAASPPAVVLTSTRDASAYQRRLGQSPARGFIAKSELTGAALSALVA
jgi:DNA-binding NarL/FixJ family response regulator